MVAVEALEEELGVVDVLGRHVGGGVEFLQSEEEVLGVEKGAALGMRVKDFADVFRVASAEACLNLFLDHLA